MVGCYPVAKCRNFFSYRTAARRFQCLGRLKQSVSHILPVVTDSLDVMDDFKNFGAQLLQDGIVGLPVDPELHEGFRNASIVRLAVAQHFL